MGELIRAQHAYEKNRQGVSRGWMIACVCAVVLLVAAVATVTVFHVLSVEAYRSESASFAEQIAALQSQLGVLESQQADASSQLEQQQSTIDQQEQQLQERESEIQKKDAEIRDKESEIQDQQDTISALQAQLAAKRAAQGDGTPSYTASDKLIALTFDDGPGPYTDRLLDAMKERGVRATFFVVGSRVNSYKDVILRIDAEGHAIGNHSQNHKNLTSLSASGISKEMNDCSQRLYRLLGHYPTVMRCPGGNYNSDVLTYAKDAGMAVIQWSVDTRDWESRNADAILKTAFQSGTYGVRNGAIVLMHDIYSSTVDAAIEMMDRLIAKGYILVTVPELLEARQGEMVAGRVYSQATL